MFVGNFRQFSQLRGAKNIICILLKIGDNLADHKREIMELFTSMILPFTLYQTLKKYGHNDNNYDDVDDDGMTVA